MSEYKSNSNRSKEELHDPIPERHTEKVVTGGVTQRKRSGLEKFVLSMFKQSDAENLENFFMRSISDMFCNCIGTIADIVCNAINLKMTGETIRRRPGEHVSYRQYYEDRDNRQTASAQPKTTVNYSYNDVIFDSRGDAENVLYQMERMLRDCQSVSVGDMFDFAGLKADYTAQKYGWTNLNGSFVERARGGGYRIDLPRAERL